jgi:hypothetical protein
MLAYADAKRLATEYVSTLGDRTGVITAVAPKPYGWIFFYNSAEFVRTRNRQKAWFGNGPFVISRIDGRRFTMTSRPGIAAESLVKYEKALPPDLLEMTPEPPDDGLRQIDYPAKKLD